MKHNPHLNHIKNSIKDGYSSEKLNIAELEEIKTLIDNIKLSKPSRTQPERTTSRIPEIKAGKYQETFCKYLSDHEQLKHPISIKSVVFKSSFDNKESVVLRLIEISGNLRLVYLFNDVPFLISENGDKSEKISLKNFMQYKKDFDKGLGKDLDDTLQYISNDYKKDNTRKITMFYYGNFDDTVAKGENFIITLMPAIIDDDSDSNYLQFTFVMMLTKDTKENEPIAETAYYDTFQLCPPNC